MPKNKSSASLLSFSCGTAQEVALNPVCSAGPPSYYGNGGCVPVAIATQSSSQSALSIPEMVGSVLQKVSAATLLASALVGERLEQQV